MHSQTYSSCMSPPLVRSFFFVFWFLPFHTRNLSNVFHCLIGSRSVEMGFKLDTIDKKSWCRLRFWRKAKNMWVNNTTFRSTLNRIPQFSGGWWDIRLSTVTTIYKNMIYFPEHFLYIKRAKMFDGTLASRKLTTSKNTNFAPIGCLYNNKRGKVSKKQAPRSFAWKYS